MSTIATLAVGLIAQYDSFVSNMSTAEKSVAGFERSHLSLRRVMEETRTPAERYENQIKQLGDWLQKGRIDTETFERAQEKAREAMKRAENGAREEGTALSELHEHMEHVSRLLEYFSVYEGARKLYEFAHESMDAAEQTEHMSAAMGLTTQQFGRLQYAAEVTGVGTETLATAFERMERNLGDAATVGGQTAQMLEHFGIKFQELRSMSPDATFRSIIKSIEDLQNPFDRATAAQAVFGRGWAQLIPLIEKGSEGLDEFGAAAERSGYALNTQQTAATVDAIEKTREFDLTIAALGRQIAVGFVPFIQVADHELQSLVGTMENGRVQAGGFSGVMIQAGVAIADAWQPVYNVFRYVGEAVLEIASAGAYVLGAFTSLAAFIQNDLSISLKVSTLGLSPNFKNKGPLPQWDDQVHAFRDQLQGAISAIQSDVDASHQPGNSFGDRLKKSLQDAQDQAKKLLDQAHELSGGVGGEGIFGGIGGKQSEVDRMIGKLQEQVDTFGMSRGAIEAWKISLSGADPVTQAYANSLAMLYDALEGNKKAAEEATRAQNKMFEEFATLAKKADDPLDIFFRHIEHMNDLLDLGAINVGQWADAWTGAFSELQKGMEPFNKAMADQAKFIDQIINGAAKGLTQDFKISTRTERLESAQVIDSPWMRPIFGQADRAQSESERQTAHLASMDKKLDKIEQKLPGVRF